MVYRFGTSEIKRFWGDVEMDIKRGSILTLKKQSRKGHLQMGKRPYLVVSNNIGNKFSDFIMVVPLTTKIKKLNQLTHTIIDFNKSMVLCEQIFTVCKEDIKSIIHVVGTKDMMKVDECLKVALGVI